MSDDRELLELAAKAGGATYIDYFDNGSLLVSFEKDCSKPRLWNPRDDDGDAFRLAVKLGIERIFVLRLGPGGVCVDRAQEPMTTPTFEHEVYRVVYDPYAAARRAVVRAAAEIGRAMP